MSKYYYLKILKKTKARIEHYCIKCGELISIGDYYYKEYIDDKFLHDLHAKKFC